MTEKSGLSTSDLAELADTDWVEVKALHTNTIAHKILYEGETRIVRLHQFKLADEAYPDSFKVLRKVGDSGMPAAARRQV